ncbi:MAG TPA: N(4)-(beta-N-acetylglucosaminyl)-L-asparaginase [Bacteroidia bacterium]|nr:N(4)-(beta-N-acetylglucosaminyl)-L-asparaginase [Bacteroidia bacterium]
MSSRRIFLKKAALGSAALSLFSKNAVSGSTGSTSPGAVVVSTWVHGLAANETAWKILSQGGSVLDAVEKGVRVVESDKENTSVGIGGFPDRDGKVTLDACIMNERGDCGSVAFLEHIENPISVARAVMEKTPHVMLVGEGALKFALEQGFKKENLLTPKAEAAWQEWLKESNYHPEINIENHDTIGMIAMDSKGNFSGACTTSGLAFKMNGRVGDSPIIGAGLYVDNEVGGAAATGLGEAVMRQCGSFLVVELMRQGYSPNDACKKVVERIVKHEKDKSKDLQVGFVALNKKGVSGAYAIHSGFNYAKYDSEGNRMVDAAFQMK